MGLFSSVFSAIGSVAGSLLGFGDDGQGLLGGIGGVAGAERDYDREEEMYRNLADRANSQEVENWRMAQRANRRSAKVGYKRDLRTMEKSDRMSDKNVRLAQRWQARQTEKAWAKTDEAALRNRRWAKADARNQFSVLRNAAERAGFNPLTVLGMGSGVAGGLSSSSYGASPGVGASPVGSFSSSVPMAGYGAPVHVPALASNAAIEGAVDELGKELTGEAAQERAYDQMAMEIAQIELEKARAGFSQPVVPHIPEAGPTLGATAYNTGNARSSGPGGLGVWASNPQLGWSTSEMPQPWKPTPGDPTRPMEKMPSINAGMMGQVDDPIIRMITGGVPANVPMSPDQEPYFGGVGVALGTVGTAIRNRWLDPYLEQTGRDPATWPFSPPSPNPNERMFVPGLMTPPADIPQVRRYDPTYGGRLPAVNLPKTAY